LSNLEVKFEQHESLYLELKASFDHQNAILKERDSEIAAL